MKLLDLFLYYFLGKLGFLNFFNLKSYSSLHCFICILIKVKLSHYMSNIINCYMFGINSSVLLFSTICSCKHQRKKYVWTVMNIFFFLCVNLLVQTVKICVNSYNKCNVSCSCLISLMINFTKYVGTLTLLIFLYSALDFAIA